MYFPATWIYAWPYDFFGQYNTSRYDVSDALRSIVFHSIPSALVIHDERNRLQVASHLKRTSKPVEKRIQSEAWNQAQLTLSLKQRFPTQPTDT